MKQFSIGFTFLFTLLLSKNISAQTAGSDKLFGTWDWINSTGGFTGTTTTPQTTGQKHSIEFTKDSICRTFKDGQFLDERKFKLQKDSSSNCYGKAYLIKYPNSESCFNFNGQDTLLLSPNKKCQDCPSSIYVRHK
jgi:hypothetical protein